VCSRARSKHTATNTTQKPHQTKNKQQQQQQQQQMMQNGAGESYHTLPRASPLPNEDSCLDRLVAVAQQPMRSGGGGGWPVMSRPPSGGAGAAAAGAAAVAAEMLGGNCSSKRPRELGGVEQQQGQELDSPRKHAKLTGGSTGGHADSALQGGLPPQQGVQQQQQHNAQAQAQNQQQAQQQHQQQQRQQQQPAPSRKPRGRATKREGRGTDGMEGQQQSMVDLPTITSQETSRKNHEEELQVFFFSRFPSPIPWPLVFVLFRCVRAFSP